MDDLRDPTISIGRTRLSARHAALVLRLGTEPDPEPACPPGSGGTGWTEAGGFLDGEPESVAGIPRRIGRSGARITLLVVSAAGLLALDRPEFGRSSLNGGSIDGSVPGGLRPAARAEPGDPGADPAISETHSMQKQFLGVAALGAALAVADASSAQAVQWRVEDGGNGHWYQHVQTNLMTWDQCQALAESRGAHLASLTSEAEWQFTFGLTNGFHTVIGGYRGTQPGNLADGWQWVTGEPWSYTRWFGGEPNGCTGGVPCEGGLVVTESWCLQSQGSWNDSGREDVFGRSCGNPSYSLLEWSADCNEDGIVDKGQILGGQLQDDDSNGVPDICQQPTCRTADLFRDFNVNGADLGILLSQWGPSTSLTVSDLNRDGVVDGIDLGLLLAFWGPCPS